MKRFMLVVLVGLLSIFFVAGMVFAQWQGGHGGARMGCEERFDALDTNHDGKAHPGGIHGGSAPQG